MKRCYIHKLYNQSLLLCKIYIKTEHYDIANLTNPYFFLSEFSDANAKFYCRIYYAGEFHRMRKVILGSSEEDFIRSLAHCVPWQARGGKSGAAFYATEGGNCTMCSMLCI